MENNRDLALCGRIRVSQRRGQVATGEGVTSVAVGTPGLKYSWSKAQTWHHVAGRSPCGRVRRPLVSAKPQSQWRTQDIGRARAMQRPWETVTGVEWGWSKPGGQGVYRGWQHQRSKWFQPFRAQKIMNEHQMSDTELQNLNLHYFHLVLLWFTWSYGSVVWDRKICTLFFTSQEPIVKRLWDFKETLDFFLKKKLDF